MKYLVKETSFVDGKLLQPGAIVDYDPPEGTTVSSNLELVKETKGGRRGAAAAQDDAAGDAPTDAAPDAGK